MTIQQLVYRLRNISLQILSESAAVLVSEVLKYTGIWKYLNLNNGLNINPGLVLTQL